MNIIFFMELYPACSKLFGICWLILEVVIATVIKMQSVADMCQL